MYLVLMDAIALYHVLWGWVLVIVACTCLALALFFLLAEMLARVSLFCWFLSAERGVGLYVLAFC